MKKSLLFISLLVTFFGYSQDIHDNQVEIRNPVSPPENVIDQYPGIKIFAHEGTSPLTGFPRLAFQHSGGTISNPSAILGDNILGSLIFSGHTGATYHQIARIEVRSLSDFSPTQKSANMHFRIGGPYGGGSNRMTIEGDSGYVGIGTSNPSVKLEVRDGDAKIQPNYDKNHFLQVSSLTNTELNLRFFTFGTEKWNLRSDADDFIFKKAGSGSFNAMTIRDNGNIGIGDLLSADINDKLVVDGKILCEEVQVVMDVTVPDYVFEKYYTGTSERKEDYTMPTLAEVENYTKENHHLPEVPSAQELKENGLELKNMSMILLQKIEELTLYTIEQEKRIKALETLLNEKK